MNNWDDQEIVDTLTPIIYERTQLSAEDSEDLAWDVLVMVKEQM